MIIETRFCPRAALIGNPSDLLLASMATKGASTNYSGSMKAKNELIFTSEY